MNKIILSIEDIELFKESVLKYEQLYREKVTFKYKKLNNSSIELEYPSPDKLWELASFYGDSLFYKNKRGTVLKNK